MKNHRTGIPKVKTDFYVPPINWALPVVAEAFNSTPNLLKQHSREEQIVRARHKVIYVLVMTNYYSFTEIGQALDRRPATISYGFQKIAVQILQDPSLQSKIKQIKESLLTARDS